VTVRRGLSLVVGLALLVTAVLLVLLAADIRAWPPAVTKNDFEARIAPARSGRWERNDRLPFGTATRVLGIDDDLEYRRTIRLVSLMGGSGFGFFARSTLARDAATRRLTAHERRDPDLRRRSAAANFLGVARFARGGLIEPAFARQAESEFRNAIRFFPGNDEAKFNLELLLQRTERQARQSGGGGTSGRSRLDETGAGSANAGRGY
jgi:hypothetical protein